MFKQVLIIVLLTISTTVWSDNSMTAQQWLEKMSHAMMSINYQGTVAFFKNNKLNTMKYFHAIEGDTGQERLLSLNSPKREVLRDKNSIRCIFQDTKEAIIDHRPVGSSFLIDLPTNFATIGSSYELLLSKEEEVAMLNTQAIIVKPKDDLRYVRKIWIEKQYFLPLKIEVYDDEGTTLEQILFTDLKVNTHISPVNVNLNDFSIKHLHLTKQQPSLQTASFTLDGIPMGFKPLFLGQMDMDSSNQIVEHLILSDGFSSISIYHQSEDESMNDELRHTGALNSLVHKMDNTQFVIMGDVPTKTIQLIAAAIQLKKSK